MEKETRAPCPLPELGSTGVCDQDPGLGERLAGKHSVAESSSMGGVQPKELHDFTFLWDRHLQEGPHKSGALDSEYSHAVGQDLGLSA